MKLLGLSVLPLLLCTCSVLKSQIKRTSVPLGDAIDKALTTGSLTYGEVPPFHIRIAITEPESPQSPYQGTIEEWWSSSSQWRREVTDKDGLRQTIVVSGGSKTEKDEGDYFPLWLRNFQYAILDPIPNPKAWHVSGALILKATSNSSAALAAQWNFTIMRTLPANRFLESS